MERLPERWRRTGIRLAMLALIAVGVYFLAIFVKHSWNLYQLSKEVSVWEDRVALQEGENLRLKAILDRYLDEEGRRLLVKKSLPYKEPGERVIIPVVEEEMGSSAPEEELPDAAPSREELASLPTWQQWWQVIFVPAPLASP